MKQQDIKSGSNSKNYQAGKNINIHHGTIVQNLSKSRLAQIAAVMAIIGTTATVLQYFATLPINAKIETPFINFNSGSGFAYGFTNSGPDNISRLTWNAWIDGVDIDISKAVRGSTPLVAAGSIYYVRNLTSPEIKLKLNYDAINKKATKWGVCMTFAGKVPGIYQWVSMSSQKSDDGTGNDLLMPGLGSTMNIVATGSGINFGTKTCNNG